MVYDTFGFMEKILLSACLAGEHTRYDGGSNEMPALMDALSPYFDIVLFCPEVAGGLPTPRKKSEILADQVYSETGENVTNAFVKGANEAVRLCAFFGIKIAVLKENSPSCGSTHIHNGRFNGRLIDGEGFTTRELRRNGIKVYNEENVAELIEEMKQREQTYAERDRLREASIKTPVIEERTPREPRAPRGQRQGEHRGYRGPRNERSNGPRGDRPGFGRKPNRNNGPRGKKPFRKKQHDE